MSSSRHHDNFVAHHTAAAKNERVTVGVRVHIDVSARSTTFARHRIVDVSTWPLVTDSLMHRNHIRAPRK
jgi:hypothetical protein